MTTERYIELIHGEIDGVNTPAESAELQKIVRDDGAAREFQEHMQQLAGTLDLVDDVEAPEGLRESIRAGIVPRAAASPHPIRQRFFSPAAGFRLAAALAAGLILGLLAGPWVFDHEVAWNPSDFAGSMTPPVNGSAVPQLRFDRDLVSGTVQLVEEEDRILVTFDVSARAPMDLIFDYDFEKSIFKGFFRREGAFDADTREGRFVVSGSGEFAGTLALERTDPSETTVTLEYRRDGELLGTEVLRTGTLE